MSYCGSPKIQEHTTWLYESQSLKKVRGVEYTHWRGFKAALQYEEVVAVLSDHRFMRSGFAFLTDGMETRGISLALTSKTVYLIVLRRAVSFEERVSIDGQSINSSPRGKKKVQPIIVGDEGTCRMGSRMYSHVTAVQTDRSCHLPDYCVLV